MSRLARPSQVVPATHHRVTRCEPFIIYVGRMFGMSSPRTRHGGVRRFAVVGLTSLAAMIGVQATVGPASASASTVQGCPSGYLCLYKAAAWNNYNARPDLKLYYCTPYNLSNWTSRHGSYINNQTGGVWSRFFAGYNGTGGILRYSRSYPYYAGQETGWYDYDFDFYPVDSIDPC